MKAIYLATTNPGKLKEISEILDIPLIAASLEIDEVQSMDLEYVSRRKAEAAFAQLKKPVIVDDVGAYIEAWNGFPGPFVKHLNDVVGNHGVVDLLRNEKNKRVKIVDAISYHDGKNVHTFVGEFTGTIVTKRGTKGWGFDPIVIPDGYELTFAEMDDDIKNKISHRGRALAKFKKFLEEQKT